MWIDFQGRHHIDICFSVGIDEISSLRSHHFVVLSKMIVVLSPIKLWVKNPWKYWKRLPVIRFRQKYQPRSDKNSLKTAGLSLKACFLLDSSTTDEKKYKGSNAWKLSRQCFNNSTRNWHLSRLLGLLYLLARLVSLKLTFLQKQFH